MNLKKRLNEKGNIIVELEGEFAAEGSAKIRQSIENIIIQAKNKKLIIIDLYKVSFIDSSGIAAIVFLYKRLKENNHELALIGVHGQAKNILELLRVHKAIHMELLEDEFLIANIA